MSRAAGCGFYREEMHERIDAYNGVNPASEFIIYSRVPDTELHVSDAGVYSQNLLANPGFELVGSTRRPEPGSRGELGIALPAVAIAKAG